MEARKSLKAARVGVARQVPAMEPGHGGQEEVRVDTGGLAAGPAMEPGHGGQEEPGL